MHVYTHIRTYHNLSFHRIYNSKYLNYVTKITTMICTYTSTEPDEHVAERGREFIAWLSKRNEENVVVVTHSAYLRHLFGHVVDCDESDKTKYANCEIRSYKLVLPDER